MPRKRPVMSNVSFLTKIHWMYNKLLQLLISMVMIVSFFMILISFVVVLYLTIKSGFTDIPLVYVIRWFVLLLASFVTNLCLCNKV